MSTLDDSINANIDFYIEELQKAKQISSSRTRIRAVDRLATLMQDNCFFWNEKLDDYLSDAAEMLAEMRDAE